MSGGIVYQIRVQRVMKAPNHYQWIFLCKHPDCDNAEHPAGRDAEEARRATENHAKVHSGDHADIYVEANV
jgi:hypothetical protein